MNDKNLDKSQKIIDALYKRCGEQSCIKCQSKSFMLLDGMLNHSVQSFESGLATKLLPAACVICNHCGYIDQYSLGVLGMLPSDSEKSEKEDVLKEISLQTQ